MSPRSAFSSLWNITLNKTTSTPVLCKRRRPCVPHWSIPSTTTHGVTRRVYMQDEPPAKNSPFENFSGDHLPEPIGQRNPFFDDLDPILQQLDEEPLLEDEADGTLLPPEEDPPVFVELPESKWFRPADLDQTFAPITAEEADLLRKKIPKPLANFFLQRAEDAIKLRSRRDPTDKSFIGRLLNDLPPSTPDWDAPENEELRDYVFVTTIGPPDFRRTGSHLFGGTDGLPQPDVDGLVGKPYVDEGTGEPFIRPADRCGLQPRLVSLFVGNVGSVDEQSSRIGSGLLAVFTLFVLFKIISGTISFFFSFSFSFFAIFALSSGLFVVFVLLRF